MTMIRLPATSVRPSVKYISEAVAPIYNNSTPITQGTPIFLESEPGSTVYGAEHPGNRDTEKYALTRVTDDTQVLYTIPSNLTVATTDAADADQLSSILMVNNVPLLRIDGDTAPAAGEWCIPAGGGTGVGASDIEVDDIFAIGATTIDIRHAAAGTGTETIALGDILTINGVDYTVTQDDFVFDDDTPVSITISPGLAEATAADDAVVITAAPGDTAILGEAQPLKAFLDWIFLETADVTALETIAAGEIDQVVATSFMFATAATNVIPVKP